jgi:predicted nucleotidyltransferase
MKESMPEKTMNKASISNIVKKLKETLTMQSDIVLVFLFGSFVRGDITSFSDLDIAIYFTGAVDFYRTNVLREDISEMLGVEADIVVLNNASPVIKMQVLKKGTLLINKDQRAYNEFFVTTVKEYDDLKRTRKEIEGKILRGRIYA